MPKAHRSQEEVEALKEVILDTAMEVMKEDGYNHISMRKVAARAGMTAANLYNYYAGKDELNLAIQTRVCLKLYELYRDAFDRHADPFSRLDRFMDIYLEFGMGSPKYYDIIYSITAPRFADFVGTDMEDLAFAEKQTALKTAQDIIDINVKAVIDAGKHAGIFSAEDARFRIMQIWSTLHGLVSLHNRGYLEKFGQKSEDLIEKIKANLLEPFADNAPKSQG